MNDRNQIHKLSSNQILDLDSVDVKVLVKNNMYTNMEKLKNLRIFRFYTGQNTCIYLTGSLHMISQANELSTSGSFRGTGILLMFSMFKSEQGIPP